MAIITPPAPLPLRNIKWRLLRPSQRVRSEWTGRSQAVILPGASRFTASGDFPPVMRPTAANAWIAFFAQLNGQTNSFALRAVEKQQTSGNNPTVNGAGQTGSSLNISGTVYLPAGSRATLPLADGSKQLVILTAALAVAGSGTMAFTPPLRSAAANAGAIEVRWPYAMMSLLNADPGWDAGVGQIYGFTLDAEESF